MQIEAQVRDARQVTNASGLTAPHVARDLSGELRTEEKKFVTSACNHRASSSSRRSATWRRPARTEIKAIADYNKSVVDSKPSRRRR